MIRNLTDEEKPSWRARKWHPLSKRKEKKPRRSGNQGAHEKCVSGRR